ncbi:hypothetical protein PV327_009156 [Microctonus hyperodae]|uniref:Uncharacterized protein n=1 Tax=Microctonus hyperodae TaxID=165561 RepID=A0AA39KVL3_MICHY|nr:hypothetical protein PV327_009156 [Microctonus hyperodae]
MKQVRRLERGLRSAGRRQTREVGAARLARIEEEREYILAARGLLRYALERSSLVGSLVAAAADAQPGLH